MSNPENQHLKDVIARANSEPTPEALAAAKALAGVLGTHCETCAGRIVEFLADYDVHALGMASTLSDVIHALRLVAERTAFEGATSIAMLQATADVARVAKSLYEIGGDPDEATVIEKLHAILVQAAELADMLITRLAAEVQPETRNDDGTPRGH